MFSRCQLDTMIFVLWWSCPAGANWTQWPLSCDDHVQQVPTGHNGLCPVMIMFSRCQLDTMIFVLWWSCSAGANWTQWSLFCDDDVQQVPTGHNDLCPVMMMFKQVPTGHIDLRFVMMMFTFGNSEFSLRNFLWLYMISIVSIDYDNCNHNICIYTCLCVYLNIYTECHAIEYRNSRMHDIRLFSFCHFLVIPSARRRSMTMMTMTSTKNWTTRPVSFIVGWQTIFGNVD